MPTKSTAARKPAKGPGSGKGVKPGSKRGPYAVRNARYVLPRSRLLIRRDEILWQDLCYCASMARVDRRTVQRLLDGLPVQIAKARLILSALEKCRVVTPDNGVAA